MIHQFKSGDLALIVGSLNASHIGQCVEVMDVFVDSQREYLYGGHEHLTEATGQPCAFVNVGTTGAWIYPQRLLMPLHGNFTPEQQKAKEAEPCA